MSNPFDIYESGQTALVVEGEQISLLPLVDPAVPEYEWVTFGDKMRKVRVAEDSATIFEGQASLDV